MFLYTLQHPNNGWWNGVKKILIEIGMEQEYESLSIVNIRFVKENLFGKFQLARHKYIESKGKLDAYKYLKTELRCEPCILSIENKGDRSLVTKPWGGIIPFAIETGRFSRFC